MPSLTQDTGAFIAALRYEDIPEAGLASVRNGFTDYTAVTILGRNDDVTRIVRKTFAPQPGPSRLCFGAERVDAAGAALVNGASAHAQDYDDVGLVGIQATHPSASIAPAVFAEAEALGRSGKDMLTAFVAGYEVWGELASRDKDPPHLKGWHSTGTFGAIAAAAAAARLHGLDASRAATAVAIASSMSAGVVANFGSMTKPYHAGRAAQSGVLAARLAANGMTATANSLENDVGFLRCISPRGEVDVERRAQYNERWFIASHGLGFKLFPMCYGAHRALDGMLAQLQETPFGPDDVETIEVEASKLQFTNLVHTDPHNALDAKFSMEFAMAASIISRRVTRAEFDDAYVNRPDVRALMKKVRRKFIETKGRDGDGMVVTLKDGRRLERRFQEPLGHARRPPPPDAIWMKFEDCTAAALPPADQRRMFDRLQHADALAGVHELPVTKG